MEYLGKHWVVARTTVSGTLLMMSGKAFDEQAIPCTLVSYHANPEDAWNALQRKRADRQQALSALSHLAEV